MQPVLDYLQAHRGRFEKELCEYLRLPSVSAQSKHAKDVRATADWVVNHCRAIGLKARKHSTNFHPIVTATTPKRPGKRPHFLVYGHYDVQPPEPLHEWNTPPFEPTIRNGAVYARGATDNKGQHFAHLKAVEAFLKTGTELPCDLTFVIEGEEEVGSESLMKFLRQKKRELKCDTVVVSDTGMPSKKHPALTYALRGVAAMEVTVRGPKADLHSGIYGGSVQNPAMALCQMLAALRDKKGRIAVPDIHILGMLWPTNIPAGTSADVHGVSMPRSQSGVGSGKIWLTASSAVDTHAKPPWWVPSRNPSAHDCASEYPIGDTRETAWFSSGPTRTLLALPTQQTLVARTTRCTWSSLSIAYDATRGASRQG